MPIEIADFWEILALRSPSRTASLLNIRAAIARHAEVDPSEDAEEDIAEEDRMDFAIGEVRERQAICGKMHYPFSLAPTSDRVLEARVLERLSSGAWLYVFLLFATRLNMKHHQTLAGVNAALLFEEICESALRVAGGTRSVVHRFGTSAEGQNFAKRLETFVQEIDEYPLRSDRTIPNHGGDDGLDLALWNTFSWHSKQRWRAEVRRPRGKLIILAQCKTGTSWDEADLNRLQPGTFFDKWMMRRPRGQMNRAFMASCRVEQEQLDDFQEDCLFLDRCRIVDYAAESLSESSLARLKSWTNAALVCSDFSAA